MDCESEEQTEEFIEPYSLLRAILQDLLAGKVWIVHVRAMEH